jgi:hypothetical protein
MSTLSNESMQPCKLRLHLETSHKDKKDKSLDYLKILRDNFQTRPTVKQMFNERAPKVDKGLLASYEISKLIAKAGKPHNIGESLILPAVSVVISTVMNQSVHEITQTIPLSNSSVSRRIDEMADDVEKQLVAQCELRSLPCKSMNPL